MFWLIFIQAAASYIRDMQFLWILRVHDLAETKQTEMNLVMNISWKLMKGLVWKQSCILYLKFIFTREITSKEIRIVK